MEIVQMHFVDQFVRSSFMFTSAIGRNNVFRYWTQNKKKEVLNEVVLQRM